MKLISAEFENFTLLRDVMINFSVDSKKNITIIRGANDSGKTMLLTALQWCLFGPTALPVSNHKYYRMSPIDMNGSIDILVEIRFEHKNEKGITDEYIATRTIVEQPDIATSVYAKSNEIFKLCRISDGGNSTLGNPESKLNQIMGSNLKELFFIDGDRALSFIDTSTQSLSDARSKVRKAIQDMLNMEVVENSIKRVRNQSKTIQAQASRLTGNEDLKNIVDQIDKYDKNVDKDEEEHKEVNGQLEQAISNKGKQEALREKALSKGNKQELADQLNNYTKLHDRIKDELGICRKQFAQAHYTTVVYKNLLNDKITSVHSLLDKLKQEGKYPKSIYPALKDLLDNEKCVCGEELKSGSDRYKHIADLIKDQDENTEYDDRILDLRSRANYFKDEGGNAIESLENRSKEYDDKLDDLKTVQAEMKEIDNKIKKLPDTNIQAINEKLISLNKNIELLKQRKWHLESKLEQNKRLRTDANRRFEEITQTIEQTAIYNYRLQAAGDLQTVLQESYRMLEDDQLPLVNEHLSKYFLEMVSAGKDNRIINNVELNKNYEILITGKNGERINPTTQLNGASRRALTLSFCLALTRVTETEAPLIIDTPLGMMDPHTKNKCLKVLQENTSQVILFLTRSEIRDTEKLLSKYAGESQTITNCEHYYGKDKKIANKPPERNQTMECICNINQYCELCERVGERANPNMEGRS